MILIALLSNGSSLNSKRSGKDLSKDPQALQRIKDAAWKAKIELSSAQQTEINQPFINQGDDGQPLHLTDADSVKTRVWLIHSKKIIWASQESAQRCWNQKTSEVCSPRRWSRTLACLRSKKRSKSSLSKAPHNRRSSGYRSGNPSWELSAEMCQMWFLFDVTPADTGSGNPWWGENASGGHGTTIPVHSKSQIFLLLLIIRPGGKINVFARVSEMAADNKILDHGTWWYSTSNAEETQIEVTFDIDSNRYFARDC